MIEWLNKNYEVNYNEKRLQCFRALCFNVLAG